MLGRALCEIAGGATGHDFTADVKGFADWVGFDSGPSSFAFRVPDVELIGAQMEQGEVDLLLASERLVPPTMKTRPLIHGRFVMAQRKGHPRGSGPLDLDAYCALQHVLVTEIGGRLRGYIDETLENQGRRRSVVLSVEKFMLVPEILRNSDYVCTLPSMLMNRFADVLDMFELPFRDAGFGLRLAWHPRNHVDPAVTWMRDLLARVVPE